MGLKIKKPKWINNKTFGIFISVIFLFLIFQNIDLNNVVESMKAFNIYYAIPAIITYALSYIIRSMRWKKLLSVSKDINFLGVLKALYIGYMANNLLPARMGEIYRAHIIGTEQNIKRSSALASIVVERIFDGLILFIMLLILVSFFYQTPILLNICITTGFIFLGGFIFIVIISRSTEKKYCFIPILCNKLPDIIQEKVEPRMKAFVDGLGVLTSIKGFLFILLTSIIAWFLEWATMYIIVTGFNLPEIITPLTIAFLVVLVAFSTMIPSGPAFVGPYQYAYILALGFSQVPDGSALAIAVTTQFIMMAPVIVVGMVLLWKSHLKLGEIPEGSE